MVTGIMTMPKTTEEHFRIFIEECELWLDKFNLRNYDLTYSHSDADDEKDACSWCKSEDRFKSAILGLTKSWDDFCPNEYQIRKFAFHEVCELLFSASEFIMQSRFSITEENINAVKHELINRLINGVFIDSILNRKNNLDRFESPIDMTSKK